MRRLAIALSVVLTLASLLTSCGPIPLTKMTPTTRVADMYWVFAMYDDNYAPLEYKEKKFEFSNEELKSRYIKLAEADQSNEEFFRLMHQYVAEFKDAHNSGTFNPQSYKGYSSIAFLGFDGKRVGDNFEITKLLPTYKNSKGLEFKVGDIITKVDGKSLKEKVNELIVPTRSLGNDESNYTALMRNLFVRSSLIHPMPTLFEFVSLTVKRGEDEEEFDIRAKWVTEDRIDFVKNMSKAVAASSDNKKAFVFGGNLMDANGNLKIRRLNGDFLVEIMMKHTYVDVSLATTYLDLFGLEFPKEARFNAEKSFELVGNNADLNWAIVDSKINANGTVKFREILFTDDKGEDKLDKIPEPTFGFESIKRLKNARELPTSYKMVMIGTDENPKYPTYPAYITEIEAEIEKKIEKDGEGDVEIAVESETIKVNKKVGYILIDTFSPPTGSAIVLEEFLDTIAAFKEQGVDSIVIDTINNGGGSLALGVALAKALTTEKVVTPGIQLALSNTWFSQIKKIADEESSENATLKSDAIQMLADMQAQRDAGARLSRTYPIESIGIGLTLEVDNKKKLSADTEIVVLVNEMCASMCDIFSGMLQDNKMATIMGTNSMGAGGNVVNHWQSPISHFQVRMTESLIVRKDGSLVENNGTKPDIELVVNEDAKEKYKNIVEKAMKEAARAKAQADLDAEVIAESEASEEAESTESEEEVDESEGESVEKTQVALL